MSDSDEFEDYIKKTETPEWREEARLGMAVMNCFNEDSEIIEDENVRNAINAQAIGYVKWVVDNPCCEDRSFPHLLRVAAEFIALWSFQAGARSGNITGVVGLDHTPLPLPTDQEIEESRQRWIESHRETQNDVHGRVSQVIDEMGLERVEKGGVPGIVVEDEGQLLELLRRLRGEPKKEEEEAPRGMYL